MELITQILKGNLKAVINILEKDRKALKACDNEGNTPWFIAARNNRVDILKILFEFCKTGIYEPNKDGITPLMIADKVGSIEAVRFLQPTNLVRLYLQTEEIREAPWYYLLTCIKDFDQNSLQEALNTPIISISGEETLPLVHIVNKCRDINVLKLTLNHCHHLIRLTNTQYFAIWSDASDPQREVLQEFKHELLRLPLDELKDVEIFEGYQWPGSLKISQSKRSSIDEKLPEFVSKFKASQSSQSPNLFQQANNSLSDLNMLSENNMRKRPSDIVDMKIDERGYKKQKYQHSLDGESQISKLEMGICGNISSSSSSSISSTPRNFTNSYARLTAPIDTFKSVPFHSQQASQRSLLPRVDSNTNLAIIKAIHDPIKVEQLISDGADVTQENREGYNVLSLSVKWGIYETFKAMSRYFPLTGMYGPDHDSLLMIALKALNSGSINVVDFNNKQINLLRIIEELIDSNNYYSDVTSLTMKPEVINRILAIALHHSSLKLLCFCCARGLYPYNWVSEEYGPLIHLIQDKKASEILKILISHGADINEVDANEQTIAHKAVVRVRKKLLRVLKEYHIDITMKDCLGNTALMIALRGSRLENMTEIIDLLLDANPDHKNVNRDILGPKVTERILKYAISNMSTKLLHFIATDPNIWKNKKGGPWLHSIVRYCSEQADYYKLINLALGHGIDINDLNCTHETILHEVVSIPRASFLNPNESTYKYVPKKTQFSIKNEIVKNLIENKADITIQSNTGHTAFNMALRVLEKNVSEGNPGETNILKDIMICRMLINPEVVFLRPPRSPYYSLDTYFASLGRKYKNNSTKRKAIGYLKLQIRCYEMGLLKALIVKYFLQESILDYEEGVFEIISEYLFGENGSEKYLKEITKKESLLKLLFHLFHDAWPNKSLEELASSKKNIELFQGLFGKNLKYRFLKKVFNEEGKKHFQLLKALFNKKIPEGTLDEINKDEKLVKFLQGLLGNEWKEFFLETIPASVKEYNKHLMHAEEVACDVWNRQYSFFNQPSPQRGTTFNYQGEDLMNFCSASDGSFFNPS